MSRADGGCRSVPGCTDAADVPKNGLADGAPRWHRVAPAARRVTKWATDQANRSRFVALSEIQAETMAALLALPTAGARPDDAAYERYLPLARLLLSEVADFERAWPGSFVVAQVAQPLVQQLSIYADYRQAVGDRDHAQLLRAEADDLTARHLGAAAAAAVHRGRAMEAAAEGRFHVALESLDRVRSVFAAAGDTLAVVQTELQLANMYEWLGDIERALDVLRAAHAQVAPQLAGGPPSTEDVRAALERQGESIVSGRPTREGEDALALARIASEVWQAEGRMQRLLGNYEEAERLVALTRPSLAMVGLEGTLDFHLAAIALGRGEPDRAERLLESSAPTFEQRLVRPRRAALRQVQADVHLARGRPAEAVQAADSGLADQKAFPDLDLVWKLQWRRARALTAMGRGEDAVAAYREGVVAADRLRMAPLGYRLDTTFLRDKLPMCEAAIDLAVARGDGPAALSFIEMVKSRALSATISKPRDISLTSGSDEARFDAVCARVDALAFAASAGSGGIAALHERADLLTERE